jgi:ABC-type branched-subunit amino acid transport system substrate-binding protein
MKRHLGLGLAAAAAILIGASGAQAAGAKLGALMPLTGGLQAYGEACLNGVKMAVDEANAAGGVLGGDVSLATGDTQTKPQAAIDAAKKLTSIEGVNGIVGALASSSTIPVAQTVAGPGSIAMISPASTAPTITELNDKDFLFRTVPSDAFQGVGLASIVAKAGVEKVAILYINNDYGIGLARSFSGAFSGVVTASKAFEPNKASYRGELNELSKGGADALVLIAYPDDGGIVILKQALEEGAFDKFIFTDGMKAEKVVSDIGAQYLNSAFGTSPKAIETDAGTAFKDAYKKAFGELPPRPFIDSSYDAAMILMLAMEAAGTTDGAKVRDMIRKVSNAPGEKILPGEFAKAKKLLAEGKDIDYVGAAGAQEFDKNGDVSGTFEHWEIKDGKLETISVFEPN